MYYIREHDRKPTIIIDLKGLGNIILTMKQENMALGGAYAAYNDVFEYFFSELKKCNVNLVFFLKNRVYTDLKKSLYNNEHEADQQKEIFAAYDQLETNNRIDLNSDLNTGCNNKRFRYNLIKICQKYGELIVTFKNHCHIIADYAIRNKEEVLSIICNDTSFLVMGGIFQYWSIDDPIEEIIFELRGTQYCRQELGRVLELNTKQMRLYAVITNCEPDAVYNFSKKLKPPTLQRFLKIAIYVKQQQPIDNDSYNWEKIADDIYGRSLITKHIEDLEKYWNMHNFDYDFEMKLMKYENILTAGTDQEYTDVVKFCKQNNYFSYHLMMETQSAAYLFSDLLYLDLRRNGSLTFNVLIYSILMKLSGILQKDKSSDYRPKTQAIFIKMSNEDSGQAIHHDIVYPNCKFEEN